MDELPYTIDDLKNAVLQRKILWTEHSYEKMLERQIRRREVLECILNGEIIEEYFSDKPSPSCLIFGITANARNMHVCCAYSDDMVYIITAYEPNLFKWNNDFKTRRRSD